MQTRGGGGLGRLKWIEVFSRSLDEKRGEEEGRYSSHARTGVIEFGIFKLSIFVIAERAGEPLRVCSCAIVVGERERAGKRNYR